MQTLTESVLKLNPPGGLFNETVIANLYGDRTRGARELLVNRARKAGEIHRLVRGVYVLADWLRTSSFHPFTIAAVLHWPSHVSLESALSFHGLIPEAVQQVASVTAGRSREFHTDEGVFTFRRVPARMPTAGTRMLNLSAHSWASVATPLRALADMVYLNSSITWPDHGREYLTESLRIDDDDLHRLSFEQYEEIKRAFKSRRVRAFLRGMRKEYDR